VLWAASFYGDLCVPSLLLGSLPLVSLPRTLPVARISGHWSLPPGSATRSPQRSLRPFATSGVILIGRGKPDQAVGTVNVAEIFVTAAVISSFLSEKGLQTIAWDLAIALDFGGAPDGSTRSLCLPAPSFKVLQVGIGLALICLNLGVVISRIGSEDSRPARSHFFRESLAIDEGTFHERTKLIPSVYCISEHFFAEV
jgi:hypothetical protein